MNLVLARQLRFEDVLIDMFDEAADAGLKQIDVVSLDFAKRVMGNHFAKKDLPVASHAMDRQFAPGDELLKSSRNGDLAAHTIRFRIPRPR